MRTWKDKHISFILSLVGSISVYLAMFIYVLGCFLLQLKHSDDKQIRLKHLDLEASDYYDCSVTTEIPIYTNPSDDVYLTVFGMYLHVFPSTRIIYKWFIVQSSFKVFWKKYRLNSSVYILTFRNLNR